MRSVISTNTDRLMAVWKAVNNFLKGCRVVFKTGLLWR
jgi:hypothetical protein